MVDREALHHDISNVLVAIRRRDEDEVIGVLMRLADSADGVLPEATWELAAANADMLRGVQNSDEEPFGLALYGEPGETVEIDEVEPALRATVRMLLAMVNGNERDARLQLEIVAAEAPSEMTQVFLHEAGWTLALLEGVRDLRGTEEEEVPIPQWLRHLVKPK
jgi:hypothetical protein